MDSYREFLVILTNRSQLSCLCYREIHVYYHIISKDTTYLQTVIKSLVWLWHTRPHNTLYHL